MPLSPYGPLPPPVARYRSFPSDSYEVVSSTPTPRRRSPSHDLMSPITTPGSIGLRRRGRQATACTECNRRKQRVSADCGSFAIASTKADDSVTAYSHATIAQSATSPKRVASPNPQLRDPRRPSQCHRMRRTTIPTFHLRVIQRRSEGSATIRT